jgi:3-oxoacid CoA-transferase subunit A
MAGFDKVVTTYDEALAGLQRQHDGDRRRLRPVRHTRKGLIAQIRRMGVRELTVVSNNCGVDGFGLGILLEDRQVRKR